MTTKISEANLQPATLSNLAGGGPTIGSIIVTDSSYNNLDDTAVALTGGYVKIIGSKFAAGCQVLIGLTPATSVTYISETEVRAQLPATAAGTYIVYLVNSDGGTAIRVNAITFSGTPTWVTGSTLAGAVDAAILIQLDATSATTFALAAGSTLPPGVTLSSGGLLSGTITGITEEIVYNFVINAIDAELQDSPRSFAFTVTAGDPYFKSTTLLLPGSANTFVKDASTNNFPVTIVGDTKPTNFNPYSSVYYSVYFDTKTDYVSIPAVANLTTFTGDFTFEAWICPTDASISNNWGIWDSRQSGASPNAMIFGVAGLASPVTGQGRLTYYNGSSLYGTGIVYFNRWNHVAFVRSGSTMTFYVNGVAGGTATVSGTQTGTATSNPIYIGSKDGGLSGYGTVGYISNFRIVNGTAVYTSNFTPSTAPLTAITNTVLLVGQNNRYLDNSTNNYILTPSSVNISSFTPFVTSNNYYGSTYFDGTGDYLTIPYNTSLVQWWDADYTIEMWIYNISNAQSVDGNPLQIGYGTPTTNTNYWSFGTNASGNLYFYYYNGGTVTNAVSTAVVQLNSWNHVAMVYTNSNTTLKGYLNGEQVFSVTKSGTPQGPSGQTLNIGVTQNSGYTGYISNLRIVRGTAVYTATFTSPTQPLTAVANTSLLTLQNKIPVANNQFLDDSLTNFLVTRAGNATQGTFSPYSPSGWSNFFDGGTNRLTTAGSAIFNLTGINFTLECWIYMTAAPSVLNRIITIGPNNAQSSFTLAISTGRQVDFSVPFGTGGGTGSSAALELNTWYHLAFVLSGSTGTMYINGVQSAQTTGWNITSSNTNYFYVGYDATATVDGKFNGYVSNVRLVKGTAVYTGAFTPPTQPLTAIAGTAILTCADNRTVDESANNIAIGITGSVRVTSWSPFKAVTQTPRTYSAYFDGSGDYLTVPASANFQFPGDFTIEGWMYFTNTAGASPQVLFSVVSGGTEFDVRWYTTRWQVSLNAGSGTDIGTTPAPANNTWTHVACVRSGSTISLYVNGVATGTTITNSGTLGQAASVASVAASNSGGNIFTGYISNVRVVKGTAVYTANFTPSTIPLAVITGTSLLTCQSATFVDNSTNNFAVTSSGNSQPTTVNPFGFTFASSTGYTVAEYGGSMLFDGTGDYLDLPNNAAFSQVGSWTLELWVYPTAAQNNYVYSQVTGNFLQINISGTMSVLIDRSGVGTLITSTSPILLNAWTHLALVSDGTNMKLFVNGTQSGSTASVGTQAASATTTRIGAYQGTGSLAYAGYISNFRLLKGQALYTSNFVPPLAPLATVRNTVLLLNGTSAAITDATTKNDLETVGDAKISTAVSKFGGSSMYFDGSGGDRLIVPSSPNFDFPGNFTIEMWINFTNVTSTWEAIISRAYAITGGWRLYKNDATNQLSWWSVASQVVSTTGSTLTDNTWSHVAVVRNSGTITIYIDGVNRGSAANTTNYTPGNYALEIGEGVVTSAYPFEGYIQDLRITNGVARYTANFTPSTTAFQAR